MPQHRGERILDIDTFINEKITSLHTPLIHKLMLAITTAGSPFSLCVISLIRMGYLWRTSNLFHAFLLAFVMWAWIILALTVKSITQKKRPEEALVTTVTHSFPSAHATMSTIFFGFLLFSFRDYFSDPLVSTLFIIGCVLACLAIGFSRIYLRVHRLSDVLAGMVLGVIVLRVSIGIF